MAEVNDADLIANNRSLSRVYARELDEYCSEESSLIRAVHALLFIAGSEDWVDRRKVSIEMRDDGCNHSRISFDLSIPDDLRSTESGESFALPITYLSKTINLHRLDVRTGSDTSVPVAVAVKQAAIMTAAFIRWVTLISRGNQSPSRDSVARSMIRLVQGRDEVAKGGLDALLELATRSGVQDVGPLRRILGNLVENYLVIALLPSQYDESRALIKIDYGQGNPITISWHPDGQGFKSRLGSWIRLGGENFDARDYIIYIDTEYNLAKSTHFEFEAPKGLLVSELLVLSRLDTHAASNSDIPRASISRRYRELIRLEDESIDPDDLVVIDQQQVPAKIVKSVSRLDDTQNRIHLLTLVPEKSVLTNIASYAPQSSFWILLGILTVTGVGISLTDNTLVSTNFGSTAPVLLAGASFALTWLYRGPEHPRAARALVPFRWVVLWSAFNLYLAALLLSVVAYDAVIAHTYVAWWFLVVITVFQGVVAVRSRRPRQHVREQIK